MKYLYMSDEPVANKSLKLIKAMKSGFRAWLIWVMFDQAIIPVRYASDGKLVAYISQLFDLETHLGTDWGKSSDYGDEIPEIVACRSGKVVKTRDTYRDTAGKYVTVRSVFFNWSNLSFMWEYWQYKHLSSIAVTKGMKVKQGQKLGMMGGTGGEWRNKDGSADLYKDHLHLCRRVRARFLADLFTGLGRKRTETDALNVIRYTDDDVLTSTTKGYASKGIFKKAA